MAEQKGKKVRLILSIVTFLGIFLLIFFARESIMETLSNLKSVKVWVLLFMVLTQITIYHGYTQLYRSIFNILGRSVRYRTMFGITSELTFVNTVFPSAGVAGFSYFGYRMRKFKINASQATLTHMMRFVAVFFAFQILLLVGVIALTLHGDANNFTILVASSIGTALAIGSVLAIYVIGNKNRINSFTTGLTKFINKIIHTIRPKHPETINLAGVSKLFMDLHEEYKILRKSKKQLKRPLLFGLLAISAEIMTLYLVFIAFGQWVNPGAVILAYAVANFAGLISVFPGGAGVYEALMTGVLAVAGVPPSIGLPATIMYRIISMTMQLPIGYFLYQRFLRSAGIKSEELTK